MSDHAIQPADEISPASKTMDEWVVNIEARLDNQVMSHPTRPIDSNSENYPSIFGKWKSLDDFGDASFLPETKKWEFVGYMTRWFGLNVRSYLEHIHEKEDLVWSYYRGVNERFRAENGKCFIEHLLVNSCFLIFAMLVLPREEHTIEILAKIIDECNDPKFQWSTDLENLIEIILQEPMRTECYILTMDYQIPWFVVEAVYTKHSNLNKAFRIPIHKLALLCFDNLYPGMHKSKVHLDAITLPPGGFKHLLHIFYWSRTLEGKYLVEGSWLSKRMGSFYIPSATDLQLSETVFEKHASGSIGVSYCERGLSGVMQLAPWHLFQYSTKLYASLLRFEWQYPDCGLPFTAYVACMVCLLQTEADVRLLRANGIIPSMRNDDKDVLRYVQEFKTLLVDTLYIPNDLYDLSAKVMARHERKSIRCYGEFKSRYCSNPWITISVIAGILLFVLTIIQTIYSALSYKKQ